jgi:hypothetical protein
LRSLLLFLRRGCGRGFAGVCFRDGKENLEARAGSRLRVQLNLPTKLADDAVHRGQTEFGALADGPGGEEWLEEVIAGSFVHATAGVRDFQDEPVLLSSFAASGSEIVKGSWLALLVEIVRLPPQGMASLALMARLAMTCSSWEGSPSSQDCAARCADVSWMSEPR